MSDDDATAPVLSQLYEFLWNRANAFYMKPGIDTVCVGSVPFDSGKDTREVPTEWQSMAAHFFVNGNNNGGITNSSSIIAENLPLHHTRERLLHAFYLSAGLAVTRGLQDKLLGQSSQSTLTCNSLVDLVLGNRSSSGTHGSC